MDFGASLNMMFFAATAACGVSSLWNPCFLSNSYALGAFGLGSQLYFSCWKKLKRDYNLCRASSQKVRDRVMSQSEKKS